ncbi:SLBB domain-containing protein [Candidatus Protochlamydia phocaeensis]|uniref:SLBB domain-containing protein n=1 Tax=Candidatus Protochlamydia phocaeensis TaxID=1414722 RepID=UPI0008382BBB|nr:SLBB domain-containing protein [Candidatus Protochlamydia phocaeensis]
MKPHLPFHEWLIICLLIMALILLSFLTLIKNKAELPPVHSVHELSSQTIQVSVKGAVARPGEYELKKGAKLKELLELCAPLSDADLSQLKPTGKLRDGQSIHIPLQEWLTIYVEGAVNQNMILQVKKGTQLKDLVDKIDFSPDADKEKMKKARRLKDQETINVPTIKAKKPKKGSKNKTIETIEI